MASIFTRIIQGELPCEKIYETDSEIVFLDIAPWMFGHTLVVSKREVGRLEELRSDEAVSLMRTIHKVAKAVSHAYGGVDYNLLLNNGPDAGQEVPHVHFHVVPRPPGEDFDFRARKQYQEGEMKETGDKIRAYLK